jgi:hypothetical protein
MMNFEPPLTDGYLKKLIRDLGAERKAVRRDAYVTLMASYNKKVVRRLISALGNKNERIRGSAAHILGRREDKEAEKPLIEALKDEKNTVKLEVCVALGNVGGPDAVRPLIELTKGEDKRLAKEAEKSIEKIRKRRNNEMEQMKLECQRFMARKRKDHETFLNSAEEILMRMSEIRGGKTRKIRAAEKRLKELRGFSNKRRDQAHGPRKLKN